MTLTQFWFWLPTLQKQDHQGMTHADWCQHGHVDRSSAWGFWVTAPCSEGGTQGKKCSLLCLYSSRAGSHLGVVRKPDQDRPTCWKMSAGIHSTRASLTMPLNCWIDQLWAFPFSVSFVTSVPFCIVLTFRRGSSHWYEDYTPQVADHLLRVGHSWTDFAFRNTSTPCK